VTVDSTLDIISHTDEDYQAARWEGLKFYLWTFYFFSFFSSINCAQPPRSGWPSSVFRRFDRRWSFNIWYRDLDHPYPNFHKGSKVRNFI